MAKRKDAPSSVLTRSGRTGIQASTNPLNTRKSPRFEKQMGPTPSTVKKKPEKSEKQMGSTPLRRSKRGKNPVDVPASNSKSTEKSTDISEESAEDVDEEKEDGSWDSTGASKKQKRYHAAEFKAHDKPQQERVEEEGSEVPAHIESPASSGDQSRSPAVGNGTPVANETSDGNADSLYQHLKPTVSKLCNILKFSEGAKIIVERFLKFVVGNFNVSKEHTSILQALMISVCWICSSLSKDTINREESFALAKKHLNFSCKEEEADQVYEKLKKPKEMFLKSPKNLNVLNAFRDRASRTEEPRMSPAVSLNHGSSNEEALQSNGQITEENIARMEKKEIDKFAREWDEKKMNIVNDFTVEKALIHYLYSSNSSVTSEKLKLVEKEIADKLNEHERSRQVHFNDLKAMLKPGVGRGAVTDKLSLNGPAHKTQIVDLVESEEEDQESREVPPALLGSPIEAESHDKPVHDLCPMVVPEGVVKLDYYSNDMVSDSHSSEKHMTNATASSKPIGEAPAKQDANTGNDVVAADASVLSEPIEDIPAKHDAGMGNDVAGADATVSSEPIRDIPDIEEIASEQMGIPAADDLTPHIESADGSHADEDPNGTGPNHVAPNVGSAGLGIPAGNCSQENAEDTTPAVQHVVSPVSDHSMPAIPEIQGDFQLIQQPSENGIQDQEAQADPTPMVEIEDDIMQHVEAIQIDQIIPEDSSLNPHDETSLVMSTNPTITENQAAVLPTSEVLVQTTALPITAQIQIQNASLLEQYMFDLQLNANSNQVGSQMTPHVDPLHIELKQLSSVKEKMVKSYEDNIQKINIDCEKEITEATAKIRLKYCNKRQEADATFNSQKKEVENNMNTVFINQVLAAVCRRKYQDVPSVDAAPQQACQAESMQQLHRLHGPSRLPGQSSGIQQTSTPPPPPISATTTETQPQQTQPNTNPIPTIPLALFLTPLTRYPPIRTPPNTNPIPIIPSTTTTSRTPPINNPITPPSRPPTTITPITPSTTPSTIISPHGMNHLTPSTTPIRPLFSSNPFHTFINTETCGQSPQSRPLASIVTHSTAPHMRPLVSREIRTPGPHMRPLASSDVRSSTSHMRPSNPTFSSGPPGSGTYHRTLPVQHVTSSLPLTSPSNSQPLPPPPQQRSKSPQAPPPSQLPHASAATSSHSSLPCGPSVPQTGGPQDELNDNVNVLTDNAAGGLNILKTPEFPGGDTAAQPPAAHEVVYLSDDD